MEWEISKEYYLIINNKNEFFCREFDLWVEDILDANYFNTLEWAESWISEFKQFNYMDGDYERFEPRIIKVYANFNVKRV